jgi:predicted RNA-binding Zn ribbon-like protein
MSSRADSFDWSGGHPALDFVNTLDERPFASPIENLPTYRDLVRFTELAGLVEPALAPRLRQLKSSACPRVAKRARILREHVFDVLTAVTPGKPMPRAGLDAIAAAIRAAHAARLLAASPTSSLANHGWSRPLGPETPLHACSLAIERLLVDVDRRRLRKCGASDCEVYFLDMSKGRRRQWCSMQGCGNREKQRRWRSGAQ